MAKQMQTCMGPLTSRGWTLNDITNKGLTMVYRYHRNTINRPRHNDRLTNQITHRPLPNRSSHFGQTHKVSVLAQKGGVSRIYRTQGVFNRFNGMRASLKLVNSILYFYHKIMRPVWLEAKISCILTHNIKIVIRQSKRKIFQIQCCVLKAVMSITVKYF